MLDVLREYALSRSVDYNINLDTLKTSHAEYYLQMAENAAEQLRGIEQEQWRERLELAHNNIRAALAWTVETKNAELVVRLSTAMWQFWYQRGYLAEGYYWCCAALDTCDEDTDKSVRARALFTLGVMAYLRDENEQAEQFYQDSLYIYRELNDTANVADVLDSLGRVALWSARYDAARPYLEESIRLFQLLGNERAIADSQTALGQVTLHQGSLIEAIELLEASLRRKRASNDKHGILYVLRSLGWAWAWTGDYQRASEAFSETLTMGRNYKNPISVARSLVGLAYLDALHGRWTEAKDKYLESIEINYTQQVMEALSACLEGLARVACNNHDGEIAVILLSAASSIRKKNTIPITPTEESEYQQLITDVRVLMERERFNNAWIKGNLMILDEIMSLVRASFA